MRYLFTLILFSLLFPSLSHAKDFALISKSTPKFMYSVGKKVGKTGAHAVVKTSKFSYKYTKKGTFKVGKSVGRFLF